MVTDNSILGLGTNLVVAYSFLSLTFFLRFLIVAQKLRHSRAMGLITLSTIHLLLVLIASLSHFNEFYAISLALWIIHVIYLYQDTTSVSIVKALLRVTRKKEYWLSMVSESTVFATQVTIILITMWLLQASR